MKSVYYVQDILPTVTGTERYNQCHAPVEQSVLYSSCPFPTSTKLELMIIIC